MSRGWQVGRKEKKTFTFSPFFQIFFSILFSHPKKGELEFFLFPPPPPPPQKKKKDCENKKLVFTLGPSYVWHSELVYYHRTCIFCSSL